MEETKKSGFSTAGLVLGIIGVCTSFIPFINNISFFMGVLAIIFGIIALLKRTTKGKNVAVIILGIITITVTLNSQKALSESFEEVSNDLDKMAGNNTEDVLANDVEVVLGDFEVTDGEYLQDTKLTVKVTNKTSETKSFDIQVEAVDSTGSRLADDYVYANNLTAGQTQDFEIFKLVTSDEIEAFKNATFNIVKASSY